MTVSGSDGVDPFVVGILHHIQEMRIDIGLTLEIKDQPGQFAMHGINDLSKKIIFHVTGVAGESTQAAGAFRAT